MTNPAETTFSSEQWQAKVEELQAQHQLELLQQQEEHLRLLQQLKAQLLQDIANANASGEVVPDSSQFLQALFFKEGPSSQAACYPVIRTSVSADPLQSFVEFEPRSALMDRRSVSSGTHSSMNAFGTSSTPSPPKPSNPHVEQSGDNFASVPRTPTGEWPADPSSNQTPQHSRYSAQPSSSIEHHSYQTPMATTLEYPSSYQTPTSELRRTALLEKHARHIEDLKQYYESELSALRLQLQEVNMAASAGKASLPGPGENADLVEIGKLSSENTRLKSQYTELKLLHEQCMREQQALEAHMHQLQQYADRYESSEKKASVLQERLEATRSNLEQQEELVRSLQQELAGLGMELETYQEQRAQDLESVEQLLKEFEVLQHEDERLHETNTSLENNVAELSQEVSILRATLSKYKTAEALYKSTINGLEDEVRHLQHVNNRLNGQATHYNLSDVDMYSKASDVSRLPRATTPSRQRVSPCHQAVTPPSGTPPTDEQGSTLQKLTRRKWLEPSEPGLIFGKGSSQDEENKAPQGKGKMRNSSYVGTEDLRGGTLSAQRRGKGGIVDDDVTAASPVESSLSSIRSGHILAWEPNGQQTYRKSKAETTPTKRSSSDVMVSDVMPLEEHIERDMEAVTKAEQKMTELQKEREQLQSALQRTPRSGRNILHDKQDQLQMEKRLDEVDKEIGTVRLALRNYHAL